MKKPPGVQKRGDRWQAVWDAGPDPRTGERRQRASTFPTMREAVRHREKMLDSPAGVGSEQPLGKWLDRWVVESMVHREDSTRQGHEARIAKYIKPSLGRVRLCELEPSHVARLYASLPEEGSIRAAVARTLHVALEEALDLELIARNPARRRRSVPVEYSAPEAAHWTETDVVRFLDHLRGADPIGVTRGRAFGFTAMYESCVIGLFAGLRLGEILGLRWDDHDVDAGVLRIHRQITTVRGRVVLKDYLKGGRNRQGRRKLRTVAIEPFVSDVLLAWSTRQKRERLAARGAVESSGFVFTDTRGESLRPQTFETWFAGVVAAAEVRRLTPHGMRHTHAAVLLRNGWPLHDVSARLGHASSGITEKTYGHVDASQAPRAPRTLSAALEAHVGEMWANRASGASTTV